MLLIHPAGPDRQALVAYLTRRGVSAVVPDGVGTPSAVEAELEAHASITPKVLHQSCLGTFEPEEVESVIARFDLVIVPKAARAATVRVPVLQEPYFLDEFLKAAQDRRRPSTTAPTSPSDVPALLKGLAHAMNNVATSSLGWLSLADRPEIAESKRRDALTEVKNDIARLSGVAKGLNLLAEPRVPGHRPATDLARLLGAGPPIRAHVEAESFGNALLFLRWAAETEKKPLSATAARHGTDVVVTIDDPSVDGDRSHGFELARLLERHRFARALGLALLHHVTARAGGHTLATRGPHGGLRVVAHLPAASEGLEADA